MFVDRSDAGLQLAGELENYESESPFVLAIPRGGVEVGYQIALHLKCQLEVVVVRKLPFPDNPESGFGAIAEDGSFYLVPRSANILSEERIAAIRQKQQQEIGRRIQILRKGRPLPDLKGKTVILVDDGIAVGSTMRAAVQLCKNKGAGKIVVAVPVASPRTVREFHKIADDCIALEQPENFYAVAQAYADWYDVTDEEALHWIDLHTSARLDF